MPWKLWRELHSPHALAPEISADPDSPPQEPAREKTLLQAVIQIVLADISMSLDNVLALAGAAREHPPVLIFGLALSVLLMGVAAAAIARFLQKNRWLAYIGLALILFVAAEMIYHGAIEVMDNPAVEKAIENGLNGLQG